MAESLTSKQEIARQLREWYESGWIRDNTLKQKQAELLWAAIGSLTADEPSSVAVNEPVFYRCETCKEIMLAAHLVGTDSHERIEETSEGQPYQVTCGPVRPSVLSAGEYINRFLPANWMNDSSLETWFPITAEELKRLKVERAAQPPAASLATTMAIVATMEKALRQIDDYSAGSTIQPVLIARDALRKLYGPNYRSAETKSESAPQVTATETYIGCDGCGMEATGRCPCCQALSCDDCSTCEHKPADPPEWRQPVETNGGRS